MTEADVLDRAADLLEEFGWCQGDYCRGDAVMSGHPREVMVADKFCASGALVRARAELCGGEPDDGPFMQRYYSAAGFGTSTISSWNDEPARIKAEVVAKLREAAQVARASVGTPEG